MNRYFKYKIPFTITLIIIFYGLLTTSLKSNFRFNLHTDGLIFFLEEMKVYVGAVGAVWLTYLLSVDRAKKEISNELESQKRKEIIKIAQVLNDDTFKFIITISELFAGNYEWRISQLKSPILMKKYNVKSLYKLTGEELIKLENSYNDYKDNIQKTLSQNNVNNYHPPNDIKIIEDLDEN